MNDAWIDLLVFTTCAGLVWIAFGRKRSKTQPRAALELEFLSTADPAVNGLPLEKFEHWFRRQVLLSQIPFAAKTVPLLMLAVSSMSGAIVLVLTDNPVLACLAALSTLLVCFAVLAGVAQWRIRQFRRQLPLAMDIMARAVRSGDSLRESVCLISETMQEPAKSEFVRLRNQLDMGLSLRSTMQSFASRIGSLDARLFATTLAVHRDTGGHLSSTLERMAGVLRSRFEYERHMQATTGMGRISVFIVVGLTWLIIAYMLIMRPEYARDLWEKPIGQQMLMLAGVLEVIGIAWAFGLMRSNY